MSNWTREMSSWTRGQRRAFGLNNVGRFFSGAHRLSFCGAAGSRPAKSSVSKLGAW